MPAYVATKYYGNGRVGGGAKSGGTLTPKTEGAKVSRRGRLKSRIKPVTVDDLQSSVRQGQKRAPRGSLTNAAKVVALETGYGVCRAAGCFMVVAGCVVALPKLAATNLVSRLIPGLRMTGDVHFWSSLAGYIGLSGYTTLEVADTVASLPDELYFKPRRQAEERQELMDMADSLEDIKAKQQARLDKINIGQAVGRSIATGYAEQLETYIS